MKSWDRTQIPKPFSTVVLVIGQPISVGSTNPAAIEEGVRDVGQALAMLETRALDLIGNRS